MNKLKEISARPATLVISSRVDARYLATTLLYWQQQGEHPRSVSELVRLNEEVFAQLLVVSHKAEFVQTQAIARELLEKAGLGTKKMNTMNQRNLVEALEAEEGVLNSVSQGRDPASGHKAVVKNRPITPDSPEVTEAQKRLETRLESGLAEQVNAAKKRTKEFKQNLGIRPEGGEK